MAKKSLSNDEAVVSKESVKSVLFTQLHDNLFIPEVGDFGKSINLDPKYSKTKNLKMIWDGSNIEWSYIDQSRDISLEGFIPGPNIKHGIYK